MPIQTENIFDSSRGPTLTSTRALAAPVHSHVPTRHNRPFTCWKGAELLHTSVTTDAKKTKAQLVNELTALRQHNAELSAREAMQQRAIELLRESAEQYRSLVEPSPEIILSLSLDFRIKALNPAFSTLTGFRPVDWIGQAVTALFHPEDVSQAVEFFQQAACGTSPASLELRLCTHSDAYISVECLATPQVENGERIIGVWGMARDVTARRQLERQRADFLTMLTHDIKNPLGVILGYTEMLLEEAQERQATAEERLIERLKSNVLTVHSLLTNYLDVTQIEAGRLTLAKRPLLLNDILRRIGQQYEAEASRRRIRLKFQLQDDLPLVNGDLLALERAFTNLISNAIKFTPGHGTVAIRSTVNREKDAVTVSVTDNGVGIAEDEVATIFEKYQRADNSSQHEGRGIGLFIVKALIEAHSGRIAVNSTLGRGTRFSVTLSTGAHGEKDNLYL